VTGDETCVHHYEPESKRSSFWTTERRSKGQHFTSDQEVKHAVRNWLKMQPADFYKAGIVSLVHRWTDGIEKHGDYIEK